VFFGLSAGFGSERDHLGRRGELYFADADKPCVIGEFADDLFVRIQLEKTGSLRQDNRDPASL